jgi:hypothetical protein
VQGDSPEKRRYGLRFAIALAAAHVVAATLVVFIISQLAPALGGLLPRKPALLVLACAAVLGIFIDARAASQRRWSLGWARQTPKHLQYLGEHAWITPYAWGFDAGLIVTTYRVSFCSWLLLLLALTGVAPPLAGIIYGLSFAISLLVMTRLVKTRYHRPSSPIHPFPAAPVQVAGIVSMLLMAIALTLATGSA